MRVVETERVDSIEGDDRVVFGVASDERVGFDVLRRSRGRGAFRRLGGIAKIEKGGVFVGRVEAEASDVDDRVPVVTGA